MISAATKSRNVRTFRSSGYLDELMAELDRASITARIQQARDEAGLTQAEFGDILDPPVHFRTVQTWESVKKPRVPWDRLDEIARVTGKSKEWLLHGDSIVSQEARAAADSEILAALQRIHSGLDGLRDGQRELEEQLRGLGDRVGQLEAGLSHPQRTAGGAA